MARSLIHPRLQTSIRLRFYPSLATVQSPDSAQDPHGQPIPAWADVLTDVACRIMPTGGSEPRNDDQTITIGMHRVAFDSHQPTITTSMRVLVDGTAYNILAVEHDGESLNTYLNVEVVTR